MNNNNPYWREESRIYNLEYEIAKTDDPEKRQRLEALLEKERQALYQKMNYHRSRKEIEQDNDDSGSFGWWLLGFLIPIVGLILWIVWHRKKPNNAHASIWGTITSVVVGIALVIIAFFVGLRITDMSFDAIKNNSVAPTTIVSSQSEPKSEKIDTKKLSQDQVKKWVYYHMKKDFPNVYSADSYTFDIQPNQDKELDIKIIFSSGATAFNYLIDSNGELYQISNGQKFFVTNKWDVPDDFTLDGPTQTDTAQKTLKITTFDDAVNYLKANKKYWSYSSEKNADTTEIISINENHPELQSDDLGSYYMAIVNTNDDDGSIYGGTKQFKVYDNGLIQQRAGMNGFYTIVE
ncbi:TPA: hypothetical protein LP521_001453 [Enterococcus faecium]|nr:hypothetical protein [Enterococcus faecium]